ncbi:GntR family transcriptional regulator [Streptomyces sp. SBT349]|uniref:GntR family transcriptional regulator n=1 Tax=Streptomyces sp. SBT349 TaxID=1580539 RepID=UPI00066E9D6C|nr:GntR family transcriptional regulator [Streptomyces sp. SBT349]
MTEAIAGQAKYHRVANALRREIQQGKFDPSGRLPAETDIAKRFAVSPPTVRQGLAVLRAEGLIDSQQGRGTFVRKGRPHQRRSRHRYGRARGDQQLLTPDLRHEIDFAGRAPVPAHIAEVMDVPTGTEVVVRRRHLFDKETGRPEEVGASYIPVEIAGGTFMEEPSVVPKALFLCVEDAAGQRYATAKDLWRCRMPTPDEAAALQLSTGAPVMNVVHTARGEDGRVLEVSESTWPADRVVIVDEYEVEPHAAEPDSPSEI